MLFYEPGKGKDTLGIPRLQNQPPFLVKIVYLPITAIFGKSNSPVLWRGAGFGL